MKPTLIEHLQKHPLVGDGAMGTMLYASGIPLGVCYDEVNRSQPNLVRLIHEEYVEAGARLLETNTFGANRISLSKHQLEHHVEELNRYGVELARQAAGADVFVAGAVGPVHPPAHLEVETADIHTAYEEQLAALAAAHPDAIILETFLKLSDLSLALKACKMVCDLPVICQLALDHYGRTDDGVELIEAFRLLRAQGADVVGVNCRSGPHGMIEALSRIPLDDSLLLSAFPNAGSPIYVDGRFIYAATPQYFSESATRLLEQGVRLIGGCCGTTPEHIRAIARTLEGQSVVTSKKVVAIEIQEPRVSELEQKVESKEPTIADLSRMRTTIIVELDPPRDMNYEPIFEGADALKKAGADALTMADNSLAVTRISNMAMGHLVKQRVGIRPFLHISCRDRNMVGLQSHLLGLHSLDIDHVLAVTGDPVKFGDQPGASNVYDVSSFELIRLIKQMNTGYGFSGRELNGRTHFTVATAFDPNTDHLDRRIRRLEKKIEAGADMAMTQPIFDPRQVRQIYEAVRDFDFPMFIGVWPLVSSGNAEFLHNEVPGFRIPDETRSRMAKVGRGKKAREEGVRIAREISDAILEYFNGLYLMTPFTSYSMTVELTEYALKGK
jgi:homocysteine S-methyltransferase